MLHHQLALSLIPGIGPKLARTLLSYLGSCEAIFDPKSDFSKIPGIGSITAQRLRQVDKGSLLKTAEREIDFLTKNQIKARFFTDEDYPERLSYCEDAPLLIFTEGPADLDAPKIVSIVGTRKPTADGIEICEKLVEALARRHPGTLIVSGLAYGIDICAHRSALQFGLPTAAVLAHGLDRIYPGMHRSTAREIAFKGALVTEFLTGTNPDRPNFVKRNRIVAGLCDATVVVESAHKGGALITAGIAASYNRDVLAFPGRVNDPLSGGCNRLIKTNTAALIESIEDLEYALGWESATNNELPTQGSLFKAPDTPQEKLVLDLLQNEKEMNLNLISMNSGIPIPKLAATLLDLEFKGLVKSRPGGIFRLL